MRLLNSDVAVNPSVIGLNVPVFQEHPLWWGRGEGSKVIYPCLEVYNKNISNGSSQTHALMKISKMRKLVRFLDFIGVPTFIHVAVHLSIVIVVAGILIILFKDKILIERSSFITLIYSAGSFATVFLAISVGVATFFTSIMVNSRDRLIDRLERAKAALSDQMKKSAQSYPEIPDRLTDLYMYAAYYIPGQSIDSEEVFGKSRVYDDWAKEEALKAISDGRKFSFGNLDTYDSYGKHLFDVNLCTNAARDTLILLGVQERSSRAVTVFPPLFLSWSIIILFSIALAILESTGNLCTMLLFPSLILLVYLMLISLMSLLISVSNIIIFITRGLEKGHQIAMDQLAEEKAEKETRSNE